MKEKMQKEEQKIRQQKEFEMNQVKETTKILEMQQKLKKQEKEREKELEMKLIQDRKIMEEKRELEQKAFFKMLNDKQQVRTQNFKEKIQTQSIEKEFLIEKWINKGMDEVERKKNQEAKEAERKKEFITKMTQNSLKLHLELKEAEKNKLKNEKEKLLQEVISNNQAYKKAEFENRIKEKEKKKAYFEVLKSQSQEILEKTKSPNRLTDTERKINRFGFLDDPLKPRFQMPGNSIVKSPSLNSNILLFNEVNKKRSLSPFGSPQNFRPNEVFL